MENKTEMISVSETELKQMEEYIAKLEQEIQVRDKVINDRKSEIIISRTKLMIDFLAVLDKKDDKAERELTKKSIIGILAIKEKEFEKDNKEEK